eukprot:413632-Pyramimonas_sp.AAC.1
MQEAVSVILLTVAACLKQERRSHAIIIISFGVIADVAADGPADKVERWDRSPGQQVRAVRARC